MKIKMSDETLMKAVTHAINTPEKSSELSGKERSFLSSLAVSWGYLVNKGQSIPPHIKKTAYSMLEVRGWLDYND